MAYSAKICVSFLYSISVLQNIIQVKVLILSIKTLIEIIFVVELNQVIR